MWEKMKIDLRKLTYILRNEEWTSEECPLPTNVRWRGIVELVGKVRKTEKTNYEIKNIEVPKSNNPKIHLEGLADVETGKVETGRPYYEETYEKILFLRRGKFYLYVRFLTGVKDLTWREKRAAFVKAVDEKTASRVVDARQGRLKVLAISPSDMPDGGFPEEIVLRGKRTRLLNHEVVGTDLSWVAYDYQMVLRSSTKFYIVSPDHLWDGLILEPGVYYLKHPTPDKD